MCQSQHTVCTVYIFTCTRVGVRSADSSTFATRAAAATASPLRSISNITVASMIACIHWIVLRRIAIPCIYKKTQKISSEKQVARTQSTRVARGTGRGGWVGLAGHYDEIPGLYSSVVLYPSYPTFMCSFWIELTVYNTFAGQTGQTTIVSIDTARAIPDGQREGIVWRELCFATQQ